MSSMNTYGSTARRKAALSATSDKENVDVDESTLVASESHPALPSISEASASPRAATSPALVTSTARMPREKRRMSNEFRKFSVSFAVTEEQAPADPVPAGRALDLLRILTSGSVDGTGYQTSEDLVFDLFKNSDTEKISISQFLQLLAKEGLRKNDPRLREMLENFREFDLSKNLRDKDEFDVLHLHLSKEEFKAAVAPAKLLVVRALQNQLIIPDWQRFTQHLGEIFDNCKKITDGKNATYIPQLSRVNPALWGVSVCTVDGQRASWGNAQTTFCFQSVSKAFNYALALEALGSDEVHKWVGQEPSGHTFNEICLNRANQPHNPMINAGAIVIASILKNELKIADRFDYANKMHITEMEGKAPAQCSSCPKDWVMNMYKAFAGNEAIGFSNQTFLSERESADRNMALAYYLREYKSFPEHSKLKETMDLYFQMCSMEATAETTAVMASTLANGGICPLTSERVVSNQACRDTLSLMHSCGMYDYSGQWAFKIGLPAKSGVSGAICIVVPNEMGICVYSPPLDEMGNSVKGIAFCKELVQRFNFHNYDSILHAEDQKVDPRQRQSELQGEQVVYVLFAAKTGDVNAMKQYVMRGMNLEMQDYDGRTALHVAASEGHLHVLRFLRNIGRVQPAPRDRWNRTPLEDARFFAHAGCANFLEQWEAAFAEEQVEAPRVAATPATPPIPES